MSFLHPPPPPFDLEEWKAMPSLARLKANCQDWAVNGFGPPAVVFLLYAIKLAIFVVAAFFVISVSTPSIGGLGDIGDWWTNPIVFQKLAVWAGVWAIVGHGSGSLQPAGRSAPG